MLTINIDTLLVNFQTLDLNLPPTFVQSVTTLNFYSKDFFVGASTHVEPFATVNTSYLYQEHDFPNFRFSSGNSVKFGILRN